MLWILLACAEKTTDTAEPTSDVTAEPTMEPEQSPTTEPTTEPESSPSNEPESAPTSEPRVEDLGHGEFSFLAPISLIDVSGSLIGIQDLDMDGYVDLLLHDSTIGFYWYNGDGEGGFTDSGILWDGSYQGMFYAAIEGTYEDSNLGSYDSFYETKLGDFNEDGQMDMAMTVQTTGNNSYSGVVLTLSLTNPAEISHSLLIFDDSHLSLTTVHGMKDRLAIFSSDGVMHWENESLVTIGEGDTPYIFNGEVIAYDFYGDGYADWYILYNGGYGFTTAALISIDENGETQSQSEEVPFSQTVISKGEEFWSPMNNGLSRLDENHQWGLLYSSTSFGAQVIGDFGGDGHLDYMQIGVQEKIAMYGNGAGMLTEQSVPLTDISYSHWVVDINNDGRDDIVEESEQGLRLLLSENRNEPE